MTRRQSIPRIWLLTDERQGDRLFAALGRLPCGSGVVFRHYSLDAAARRALFERVKRICRRRRYPLILAGNEKLALKWKADGFHSRDLHYPRRLSIKTAPAHNLREAITAKRTGARLIFLSPIFHTRSHPGARTLGPVKFGLIAHRCTMGIIALGGMNARREQRLRGLGASGYGAIDFWNND